MAAFKLIVICVLAAAVVGTKLRFDGYQLIDITPQTGEDVDFLQHIPSTKDLDGELSDLDFQPECVIPGLTCQALVSPSIAAEFKSLLHGNKISFEVVSNSFQKVVEEEQKRINEYQKERKNKFDQWDEDFHPYDETLEWLKNLAQNNPGFIELLDIGKSYEGRDQLAIRIGLNASAPSFFFDGVIHAREWLATATVQYMINRMVEGVNNGDPLVMRLVNGLQWYILPIFNPDGYEYTWTTNRLWRKTRSPNAGSSCVGTDPNRNADAGFGGPGSSGDPCSNTYRGPYAFSEREVDQVCQFVLHNITNPVGYNNIHANTQMLLSPYGYTFDLPADYNDHQSMHQAVAQAIESVHGAVFRYGPISTTIYLGSGGGTDWLYDEGVKYSIGWEVRGNSFAPPPEFIVISGEEIWAGMIVLGERLIEEYN